VHAHGLSWTQERMPATQECMTATQDCMTATQECMTATQECMTATQECMTATQDRMAANYPATRQLTSFAVCPRTSLSQRCRAPRRRRLRTEHCVQRSPTPEDRAIRL
jgi:hypothetical protein